MQISADQSKAGRALLGWTQGDLATHAKVNKRTVMDFESGCREPHPGTLALLVQAFEQAGVEFIADCAASPFGGAGVRSLPRHGNWLVNFRAGKAISGETVVSFYVLLDGGYSASSLPSGDGNIGPSSINDALEAVNAIAAKMKAGQP